MKTDLNVLYFSAISLRAKRKLKEHHAMNESVEEIVAYCVSSSGQWLAHYKLLFGCFIFLYYLWAKLIVVEIHSEHSITVWQSEVSDSFYSYITHQPHKLGVLA